MRGLVRLTRADDQQLLSLYKPAFVRPQGSLLGSPSLGLLFDSFSLNFDGDTKPESLRQQADFIRYERGYRQKPPEGGK
jgi:hypothetical protein